MLQQFDKQSLSNAYVLCEDASIAITKCPDEQIDRIDIHHPDPWPKKRHHKRRLIQIEFIEDCLRILKPGGTIEIVTDDSAYFDDIMHLLEHDLESHCRLQTQHEREPNSKYGRKAIIEGETFSLSASKKSSAQTHQCRLPIIANKLVRLARMVGECISTHPQYRSY